jgi:shikimate 5-dehydrogenase
MAWAPCYGPHPLNEQDVWLLTHYKQLDVKDRRMLLENKNAVIYGGGGSIGGAVAREFSREGARVFLVGRTCESLEFLASDKAGAITGTFVNVTSGIFPS